MVPAATTTTPVATTEHSAEVEERFCGSLGEIVDQLPDQELEPFVLFLVEGASDWRQQESAMPRINMTNDESGVWGLTTHSFSEMSAFFKSTNKSSNYEFLVDLIDQNTWYLASSSLHQMIKTTRTDIFSVDGPDSARIQLETSFGHNPDLGVVKVDIGWKGRVVFVSRESEAFDWLTAMELMVGVTLMVDRAWQTILRIIDTIKKRRRAVVVSSGDSLHAGSVGLPVLRPTSTVSPHPLLEEEEPSVASRETSFLRSSPPDTVAAAACIEIVAATTHNEPIEIEHAADESPVRVRVERPRLIGVTEGIEFWRMAPPPRRHRTRSNHSEH